jgi:hypothetical protein
VTPNRYRVQKDQWSKWTDEARELFNDLYGTTFAGKGGPSIMGFVDDAPDQKRWDVIRWNNAWLAASNLSQIQKAKKVRGAPNLGVVADALLHFGGRVRKWSAADKSLWNRAFAQTKKAA